MRRVILTSFGVLLGVLLIVAPAQEPQRGDVQRAPAQQPVLPAEAAAPGPRRELGPEAEASLQRALGRHPFVELRARASGEREAVGEDWLQQQPEELRAAWCETLVCALWSEDRDVAFAAACRVPEWTLDLADIDRWLTVARPHLQDAQLRFDWDTFKHVVDVRTVTRLLSPGPLWDAELRYSFVQDSHRSLRPEHVPALCQLVHDPDPILRRQAWSMLSLLSQYGNGHRRNIAAEILKWPGRESLVLHEPHEDPRAQAPYEPRALVLAEKRDGWPPLLHATLRRYCLELAAGPKERDPELLRLGATLAFDTWLLRWAEDEPPGLGDLPLLRELLAHPRSVPRWMALRAVRRLGGVMAAEDRAALRAAHAAPPAGDLHSDSTNAPALRARIETALAMAAFGDDAALATRSAEDPTALAVALEHDAPQVWEGWVAEAFGADAERGLRAIQRLAEARDLSDWGPLRFPERVYARLRQATETYAADLEPARLGALALAFPGARSRAQAARWLAGASAADLPPADAEELAAMLEVHDAERLRATLRRWLAEELPADQREVVLELYLGLGDPAHGGELVAHVLRHGIDDPLLLARSGASPAVRDHLTQLVQDQDLDSDLAALAAAHGLPERVARRLPKEMQALPDDLVRQRRPQWKQWILAGDPAAVVADLLQAAPPQDPHFPDVGLVDDARVRAALERLRATPGSHVQWAIGELALAGDPAALAELAQVRERRLYGWMDSATRYARTLGRRLELVPYWIGEIGTNCCRRNGAVVAIEGLTGLEVHGFGEDALATQHEQTVRWWERAHEQLRWSRIAGRYVVAPR